MNSSSTMMQSWAEENKMKKGFMNAVFVATCGLFVTTIAFALEQNPLRGLYVGGSVGGHVLTMQESVNGSGDATVVDPTSDFLLSGTIPLSSHADMVNNSVLGQLYAGYGFVLNSLYLSGELAVGFVNGVANSERSTGLSEQLSFGGPSVELTGSTSVVNSKASISPTQFSLIARPGLIFKTNGLLFGKVGVNFSDVSYQVTTTSTNRIFGFPSNPITISTSANQHRASLLLGGGIEYLIFNRWTLRADYTYINFGRLSNKVRQTVPLVLNDGTTSSQIGSVAISGNNNIQVQDQSVTIGLVYHFDAL